MTEIIEISGPSNHQSAGSNPRHRVKGIVEIAFASSSYDLDGHAYAASSGQYRLLLKPIPWNVRIEKDGDRARLWNEFMQQSKPWPQERLRT